MTDEAIYSPQFARVRVLNRVLKFVRQSHCQSYFIGRGTAAQINKVIDGGNTRVEHAACDVGRPCSQVSIFVDGYIDAAISLTKFASKGRRIVVIQKAQHSGVRWNTTSEVSYDASGCSIALYLNFIRRFDLYCDGHWNLCQIRRLEPLTPSGRN